MLNLCFNLSCRLSELLSTNASWHTGHLCLASLVVVMLLFEIEAIVMLCIFLMCLFKFFMRVYCLLHKSHLCMFNIDHQQCINLIKKNKLIDWVTLIHYNHKIVNTLKLPIIYIIHIRDVLGRQFVINQVSSTGRVKFLIITKYWVLAE